MTHIYCFFSHSKGARPEPKSRENPAKHWSTRKAEDTKCVINYGALTLPQDDGQAMIYWKQVLCHHLLC